MLSEINPVATYRRIADVLRSTQRAAIEVENAPDKRKRLRSFSIQEVATLLGVKSRDVTTHMRVADDRSVATRSRLTFEDILKLRESFYHSSGDRRFVPAKQPEKGESMATIVFSNFKVGQRKQQVACTLHSIWREKGIESY
jgi:chromosome partitioning protein